MQTSTLPGTIAALDTQNFAVRYDAQAGGYIIDLPYAPPGRFHANSQTNDYWTGGLENQGTTSVTILKPSQSTTAIKLTYTTFAKFVDYSSYSDYDISPAGDFAFGTATPAGSVPTSGSATYDAIVAGLTLDRGFEVGGTASLQFDFGAGTLAGSFSPVSLSTNMQKDVSLGTYTFVNTVFGVGRTTFSGSLAHAGFSTLGAFNGLFTGPAAQELMAKWTAPYQNPDSGQMSEMAGVWVGRKP